jgi:hypothetical protein
VVADVDNDLHAEIVLASNNYGFMSCPTTPDLGACELARIAAGENVGTNGVRVFASPTRDWGRTRRIWNQHTYHVTNVSEAGAIPSHERPNWSSPGLNNFRLNVQPGATNLADLVPIDLAVDLSECTTRMTPNFRVENQGWGALPPGAVVAVYVEEASGFVLVARVTTTRLLPARRERALRGALRAPRARHRDDPLPGRRERRRRSRDGRRGGVPPGEQHRGDHGELPRPRVTRQALRYGPAPDPTTA